MCILGATNIQSMAGKHDSAHDTLEMAWGLNFQWLPLGDVEAVGLCSHLENFWPEWWYGKTWCGTQCRPQSTQMLQDSAPVALLCAMMDMPLTSHGSPHLQAPSSFLFVYTYPVTFLFYLAPGHLPRSTATLGCNPLSFPETFWLFFYYSVFYILR